MKKIMIKVLFIVSVIFSVSLSATSQVYVQIRPPFTVQVRPVQPSPAFIWVEEDWQADGNSYRYSGGHWESPRNGYYRKAGYWKHDNRGHRWVPAGWYKQQQRGKGKWKIKKHS